MCCEYQSSKADLREIETHTTRNTYLRTDHHTTTPRTRLIDIEDATLGSVYVYFDVSSLSNVRRLLLAHTLLPALLPACRAGADKALWEMGLARPQRLFLVPVFGGFFGPLPRLQTSTLEKSEGA